MKEIFADVDDVDADDGDNDNDDKDDVDDDDGDDDDDDHIFSEQKLKRIHWKIELMEPFTYMVMCVYLNTSTNSFGLHLSSFLRLWYVKVRPVNFMSA